MSLTVGAGEIHALMGPNGSGKSTLAKTLLANPAYEITRGHIRFKGEDVTRPPEERAARGLFLGFQHPEEISGVSVLNFLRQAMAVRKGIDDLSVLEVRMALMEWTKRLGMDDRFPSGTSTRGSRAARRSATRSCRWRCWSPTSRCSTRPTPASTSTRSRSSPRGSHEVRTDAPRSASS